MKTGIDSLVEAWANDGAFRSAFSKNQRGAAAAQGIHLDEHEWDAVSALGLSGKSSALDARINPEGGGHTIPYC